MFGRIPLPASTWQFCSVLVLLSLFWMVACSEKPGPVEIAEYEPAPVTPPPPANFSTSQLRAVTSVEILPTAPTVLVGGTEQLIGIPRDEIGQQVSDRLVEWFSDNTEVLQVNPNTGVVTGIKAGTAQVEARIDGIRQVTAVLVEAPRAASLEIPTGRLSLVLGKESQLQVLVRDSLGNQKSGEPVVWTSEDSAIAVVDPATGRVVGLAPGEVEIIARLGDLEQRMSLIVEPPSIGALSISPAAPTLVVGGRSQLALSFRSSDGLDLAGRPAVWSSDKESVVTVDQTGVITGISQGTAYVSAVSGRVESSVLVTVELVPVASVAIEAKSPQLTEGKTIQMSASALDTNGNTLPKRAITWTSSDPSIATVDPDSGVVTGINAGETVIFAHSEGVQSNISLVVSHGPIETIQLSNESFSIIEGSRVEGGTVHQLTATLKDSKGHVLSDGIFWSSGNEKIAVVDPSGQISGVEAGVTDIIAEAGGVTGKSTVTVTHGSVSKILISGVSNVPIVEGTTAQGGTPQTLTAILQDAIGHVVAPSRIAPTITSRELARSRETGGNLGEGSLILNGIVAPLSWSSSDPSIATVSSSGEVTGMNEGTVNVIAASGNVSASIPLRVVHGPPATVTISGQNSLAEDNFFTYTALVTDALGHVVQDESLTWSSSNSNLAVVRDSSKGRMDALTAGIVSISSTTNTGKIGKKSVTIVHTSVAIIKLPNSLAVVRPTATLLAASLIDTRGHLVEPTGDVQWKISGPDIIKVTPLGGTEALVSGNSPGTSEITAIYNGKSSTVQVTVS